MSTRWILAAFLRRDWAIDISYRAAFGLQIFSVVMTLALFYYLGNVVDPDKLGSSRDLAGGYFGFVAVGLALYEVVSVGLISFSEKLREEQTTGTLEALMATPVSPGRIVLFSSAYDMLRATLSGILVMAAAILLFGLRLETDPVGLAAALVALLGCVGIFASLGIAIAAFTVLYKKAAGLTGLVATVLALLGGVYFPVDVLPGAVQAVANALPFTWGLDVTRDALLGGQVQWGRLAGLIGSVAVLIPAALLLFTSSVHRARRLGTLAQY